MSHVWRLSFISTAQAIRCGVYLKTVGPHPSDFCVNLEMIRKFGDLKIPGEKKHTQKTGFNQMIRGFLEFF